MTGISQEVGNFSEQVWGVPMSVVNSFDSGCVHDSVGFRR
jgi:hypothetical protein